MAEVVPEVSAFGFVESDELCGLRCRRSGQLPEFAGGTLADFGTAFYTHAKVPRIRRNFSLKRGGGRFRRILFSFKKELYEMRANEINRSGADWRPFDKCAESESVFMIAKRDDEAAAGWRCGKRAEVEARDNRERAERADKQFVEVVAGDVFDDASAALAEAAGAIHKFRADEEVAGGAVRMA